MRATYIPTETELASGNIVVLSEGRCFSSDGFFWDVRDPHRNR